MPAPSSPISIFGTDLASSKLLLDALIRYAKDPTDEVKALGDSVLVAQTSAERGRAFWSRFYDAARREIAEVVALGNGDPDFSGLDLKSEVPLFDDALRALDTSLLDSDPRSRDLFTTAGRPRSRAVSRVHDDHEAPADQERDLNEQIAADLAAAQGPAGGPPAGLAPDRAAVLSPARSVCSLTPLVASGRRARAHELDADYDSADASDGGGGGDEDNEPLSDEEREALADLRRHRKEGDDHLPLLALKARKRGQAFLGSRHKADLEDAVQRHSNCMPAACVKAIMRNQYVDYGQVYAHEPGRTYTTPLGGRYHVEAEAPSRKIPNFHAWLVTFRKVRKVTLEVYSFRKPELDAYEHWFSGQVLHREDLFELYRDYDDTYRKNFGAAGYGHSLLDAIADSSAQMRLILHPATRSLLLSGGGSTRRQAEGGRPSKRTRLHDQYGDDVCGRFNEGVDHDASECRRTGRAHKCSACGSTGHGRSDPACPSDGGKPGAKRGGGSPAVPPVSLRK